MVTHTRQSVPREDTARLLLETDHPAEAFDEIALAINKRPRDAYLRLLASDAYERLGALPEAADHLSVILAAEPEHLEANRRLAELLCEIGDTQGAIRCWRRLVAATDEEDADAVTLLAIALCTDGQHEGAIELLTKLTYKHPLDAASLANLGMALLAAGREGEAQAALTRAVALDPQSAQAHCGIGLAHYEHARWQEAAAAFRATERFAPDSAIGSFNLGLALERLGERDEARRALLRAAALEPHDEEIQRALEPLLVRHSPASSVPDARDAAASIRGDLASFDLLNVLEFLRMQEKTGSLVISAPMGVGMLRLERGMLIGGSAPRLKRLGEVLVRRGLLSRESLQSALAKQRQLYPGLQGNQFQAGGVQGGGLQGGGLQGGGLQGGEADANTLGAVLLRERLIDEKQLSDVLFRMILHVVSQIKQWREGVFAFHPSVDTGFPIRFNVQEVVLDLMRLEDERRQRTEHS
jgi:tetratricopeptide (TPR) repeat protein